MAPVVYRMALDGHGKSIRLFSNNYRNCFADDYRFRLLKRRFNLDVKYTIDQDWGGIRRLVYRNMILSQMKRHIMGIQQQEIEATEVIIRTPEKELIFSQPSVSKVNMMGQDTWQIVGEAEERELTSKPEINEEDIKTALEQINSETQASPSKWFEDVENDLIRFEKELKPVIKRLREKAQSSNAKFTAHKDSPKPSPCYKGCKECEEKAS